MLHGPAHPYDEAAMRDIFTREVERDPNFQSSANHSGRDREDSAVAQPLASLDVPTLVIHGTADPILPYEHGVALAKDIAGAELLTMEGVGHELPGEEMDSDRPGDPPSHPELGCSSGG